jgi:hypothetical protein
MAGDLLRDAFRSELATIRTAASITWVIKDTLNTNVNPDASAGYLELEFPGGAEDQYTFGAPSNNLHREQGQVTVRVVSPRGNLANRDLAETYAAAIRSAFRMRRFAVGSLSARITSTAPMGGGEDEGGMWSESIALGYEIYNVG